MIPVLQALVLAEKVYEDKTGKKIIAGTFTGFEVKKAAMRIHANPAAESQVDEFGKFNRFDFDEVGGSPYAYISLTDVVDNTKIDLQFVSLALNQVLFGAQITIQCKDRLATVEAVVPLPPLSPFVDSEKGGVYLIQVVCKSEILGSYRLNVKVNPD